MDLIYDSKSGKWVSPISETIYFANEDDHQLWLESFLHGDFRRTVHAHWRPGAEPPFLVCSHCERRTCTAQSKTPFCPECGSKMDEDTMTAY